MTLAPKEPRKRKGRIVQARGEVRRRVLLETAFRLVLDKYIEDITYPEISRESGIPLASCYHFFPGKMELFAALIDYAGPWHRHVTITALLRPAESWAEIFQNLSDALVAAYDADLAFVQLFSTWKIPGSVYAGRESGIREAAERIRLGIDRQFVRTRFQGEVDVFLCATRMSDAVWRASMADTGHVSLFAKREAQRAVTSYLENYIPPLLDARETPADSPALTLPNEMPAIIAERLGLQPRPTT